MSYTSCVCGYCARSEKFNRGEELVPSTLTWLDHVDNRLGEELLTGTPVEEALILAADVHLSPRLKMLECPACWRLLVFLRGDLVRVYVRESDHQGFEGKTLASVFPAVPPPK